MTKRDYEAIAAGIVDTPMPHVLQRELAANIAQRLFNVNPRFCRQKFMECFKNARP